MLNNIVHMIRCLYSTEQLITSFNQPFNQPFQNHLPPANTNPKKKEI